MRAAHRPLIVAFAVGLVLFLGGCAGGSLDDGNGPNVVLAVSTFPAIPPIQTTYSDVLLECVMTAPASVGVSLTNQAKNSLAASPFSDVSVESATVTYYWDDAVGVGDGPYEQSTAGLIKVGSSGSVPFSPIAPGASMSDRAGHSASMVVMFHGRTVDGKRIDSLPYSPGGSVLQINACVPTAE